MRFGEFAPLLFIDDEFLVRTFKADAVPPQLTVLELSAFPDVLGHSPRLQPPPGGVDEEAIHGARFKRPHESVRIARVFQDILGGNPSRAFLALCLPAFLRYA